MVKKCCDKFVLLNTDSLMLFWCLHGDMVFRCSFDDRNALNIVKDDLIAKVDELTRYIIFGLL